METTALSFNKQSDGTYAASFVSTGLATIQISRKTRGIVSVRANIPGMTPVPVIQLDSPYSTDVIFELDIAEGLEVTVISSSEVLDAKIYA